MLDSSPSSASFIFKGIMSSQPLDEDGFHSIAWDDAPPRPNSRPILTDISGSDDGEGFETISPSPGSPVASTSGSTARDTDTVTERQYRDRGEFDVDKQQTVDFHGKWMSIEVRDPVKEHEGSKDMFVSYAVRNKVSSCLEV
jgi:sorting nexin-4